MDFKPLVLMGAAGFGAVAAMIYLIQRKAKTCSVHSHAAGQAAQVLAVFCMLVAAALVALACMG